MPLCNYARMFTDFKSPGIKPRFCELDTIPLTLLGKCYQIDTCRQNLFHTKMYRRNKGLTSKTFHHVSLVRINATSKKAKKRLCKGQNVTDAQISVGSHVSV